VLCCLLLCYVLPNGSFSGDFLGFSGEFKKLKHSGEFCNSYNKLERRGQKSKQRSEGMSHDVEDLTFLLALETKHDHQVAIFDKICKDQEYLGTRPALLKAIVALKTKHSMHNSIVYLTASLLDAIVAQNIARKVHDYNLHVFAVACLCLAAKFIDGPAVYFQFNACQAVMAEVKCRASKIPLSQIISSWVDACDATVELSKFLVLQCEVLVSNQLDWRFNRATADRFLQAHLTQCSSDESFSTDLATTQVFLDWAIFFCEMTVMSNLCCQVKPSVISMASILAARNFLFNDSGADLLQLYWEQDEKAVLACKTEILDMFEKRNVKTLTAELHGIKDTDKILCSLECIETMSASASFPSTPVQMSAQLCTDATSTPPPKNRQPSVNFVWDSPPFSSAASDPTLHSELKILD